MQLSESQQAVLKKYLVKNETNWEQVARRVSKNAARAEATIEERKYWEDKFYEIIYPMKFIPAGSILANSDNGTGGLCNCFVLSAEDNMESITQLVSDSLMTTRFRGGIGINIGSKGQTGYIREEGAPYKDGTALGPLAVLDMVSYTSKQLTSGNRSRRGAFMFSMDWRHPDIFKFIRVKTQSTVSGEVSKNLLQRALNNPTEEEKIAIKEAFATTWKEDHLSPDGTRSRRWQNANISVQLDGEFFADLEAGDILATELWHDIADLAHRTADPGIIFIDKMRENSPIGEFITTTNPCFAAGTMVMTREGHFPIEDLVGKVVEIWDGQRWVEIDNFRITAENQETLDVTLHSGQVMTVTPYHKFILEDGTRVEARNLVKGSRLKHTGKLVQGNIYAPGAYAKGFLLGDGSLQHSRCDVDLNLHGAKIACFGRLKASLLELEPREETVNRLNGRVHHLQNLGSREFTNGRQSFTIVDGLSAYRDKLYPWVKAARKRLPNDIYNWTTECKAAFLAGYFDADGNARDHLTNGYGYQVCSVNKESLIDVQTLMLTLGVRSKLGLMKSAETKDFGPNLGGVYQTKDSWRLSLTQKDSKLLATMCDFERLTQYEHRECAYSPVSNSYKVVSVTPGVLADKVYCCTVPNSNTFTLSTGLLTSNCGELALSPNSSCNLGSLSLPKFWIDKEGYFDTEGFKEATKVAVRFLDNVLDVSTYATAAQKDTIQNRFRQVGLGIMGGADLLKLEGIPYDSQDHLDYIDELGMLWATAGYQASEELAVERGVCGVWDEIKDRDTHNVFDTRKPRRNSTVLSIAPTGSIAQLGGVSWAFEPDFGLSIWKQIFVDAAKRVQQWVQVLNPYVEDLDLSDDDRDIVLATGSLIGTQFALDNPREARVFAISREITPEWHVKVQACWQKYIDSSISKTINCPAGTTPEQIQAIYLDAYRQGIKGITIYREGTLESEPIKVGTDGAKAPKRVAYPVSFTGEIAKVADDDYVDLAMSMPDLLAAINSLGLRYNSGPFVVQPEDLSNLEWHTQDFKAACGGGTLHWATDGGKLYVRAHSFSMCYIKN